MSLQTELKSERVDHLAIDGFSKVSIGTSIRNTLAQMRTDGKTVCLVTDNNGLVGIFTDRDVMRKVIDVPGILDKPVDEVMTLHPITAGPQASAADALRLMDENQFRNLPIVDTDGNLLGNMTHQAIIQYLADRYPVEVLNRPSDPEHFPRKAEGG